MKSNAINRKSREKNILDSDIEKIIGIITDLDDPVSWASVIDAVEMRLFRRYTRQSLASHDRIRISFESRKKSKKLSGSVVSTRESADVQVLRQRNERLIQDNLRLTAENNALLERFALWAYNAHSRGLGQEVLDQPLPPNARRKTG